MAENKPPRNNAHCTLPDDPEQSTYRFIIVAAKRARQLARGAEAHLPWGDHKSTVLTLKEIAGGYITNSVMSEADLPAIQVSKMDLELPELAPDI